MKIWINKKNNIIILVDNYIKTVGDYFLDYNEILTSLELPLLANVGNNFLYYNENLKWKFL
jgi:hypothetical protein